MSSHVFVSSEELSVVRLQKLSIHQNTLYIMLLSKLFQMSLIRLPYENSNKGIK